MAAVLGPRIGRLGAVLVQIDDLERRPGRVAIRDERRLECGVDEPAVPLGVRIARAADIAQREEVAGLAGADGDAEATHTRQVRPGRGHREPVPESWRRLTYADGGWVVTVMTQIDAIRVVDTAIRQVLAEEEVPVGDRGGRVDAERPALGPRSGAIGAADSEGAGE